MQAKSVQLLGHQNAALKAQLATSQADAERSKAELAACVAAAEAARSEQRDRDARSCADLAAELRQLQAQLEAQALSSASAADLQAQLEAQQGQLVATLAQALLLPHSFVYTHSCAPLCWLDSDGVLMTLLRACWEGATVPQFCWLTVVVSPVTGWGRRCCESQHRVHVERHSCVSMPFLGQRLCLTLCRSCFES